MTVSIDMPKRPHVRGRIVLDAGIDMESVHFRAYAVLQFPSRGFDPARGILYGTSYGSGADAERADLQLNVPIQLNADGSFDIAPPVSGAALTLLLHAPGQAPTRVSLGSVRDDLDGVELAPPTVGSATGVAFSVGGVAAAGMNVMLTDLTDPPLQSLVQFQLDREGRAPPGWMERHRSYWIILTGAAPADGSPPVSHDGLIHYDGEAQIEVESLRQDVDEFLRELKGP